MFDNGLYQLNAARCLIWQFYDFVNVHMGQVVLWKRIFYGRLRYFEDTSFVWLHWDISKQARREKSNRFGVLLWIVCMCFCGECSNSTSTFWRVERASALLVRYFLYRISTYFMWLFVFLFVFVKLSFTFWLCAPLLFPFSFHTIHFEVEKNRMFLY